MEQERKEKCRNTLLKFFQLFLYFSTHKQMTAVPDQSMQGSKFVTQFSFNCALQGRRNADEESTNKVLASNREVEEYRGKLMATMKLC
jgi:uncharacterized protein YcgL (UPF0745 family)